MAEQAKLAQHANTAIYGLIYAAEFIDEALFGKKRHLDAQVAEHTGPFALAMHRLGAFADGGAIEDLEAARSDLLFTFPLMRHLGGGFYGSMQEVLFAAHLRCADLITLAEAEDMMGEYKYSLRLEAALGHIHLIVRNKSGGKEWRGYDATYLGEPGEWYEVRYAGYEIRAERAKYDKQTENMNRWKAEQQAAQEASMPPTPAALTSGA